jgi:rhamnosyltransferase subunit B
MSKIVITTIGSLGDLHPQIAIALELRKRGHNIVFAAQSGYQAKIEALGFEFHRLRPDSSAMEDPQEMARMMDLKTGSEYIIRQWLMPNLRDTYTDLMTSAKDADLIIAGEIVYPARLVAEKLRIPWATSLLQPIAFFSTYDPSVIPLFPFLAKLQGLGHAFNLIVNQLLKAITKSWTAPIHQFRKELKLPSLPGNLLIDNKCSPYLVLALFSSVLAQPQPDWPKHTIVTGFTFYDGDSPSAKADAPRWRSLSLRRTESLLHLALACRRHKQTLRYRQRDPAEFPQALQEFLKMGEPPIVFTLGSAAVLTPGNFYQESMAAATQLKRRAILLIGGNTPPVNLPADIIAVDYVPYSQIFPCACVIVHQGGIGTTAQALRAGVPTLIMPYSHDQPDNAARVERLGTSRTISRQQYTGSRVAKELQILLENSKYATKAVEIGHILQSENGVKVACDAIDRQLEKVIA